MGGVYTWVSFKHWNVACRSVRKNRILFHNYGMTANPFLIINLTEKRYPSIYNCCAFATETPYWLAGWPWPQTFPSDMDALPFISPGVCEGICKDSDAPCFQSCPPKSEGSMKFACKAKKWHKVTETCHTLNAMNMFEVRSFSPLSWILMRTLWVKWSFRWDHEAHLGEEIGFHSSNGLWVHELINTYLFWKHLCVWKSVQCILHDLREPGHLDRTRRALTAVTVKLESNIFAFSPQNTPKLWHA